MGMLDRVLTRRSLLLAVLVTVLGLVGLARHRETRATERVVDRLLDEGAANEQRRDGTDARVDLPEPVQQYFETAFSGDPHRPRSVRIEQEGTLRVGGPESSWKPFTATHHATVHSPGFVWNATVKFAPFVSVRVRDAFVGGEGSARVALFGALPLGSETGSPELNEAALQRYLAEAVWYPTALRPENGVSWEGIDEQTARATLEAGKTTASLTFHFSTADGDGDETVVERVHTERRYRAVGDGFEPTPWTGLWREYEERDGRRVPTEGEVVWHLDEGDLHAWRGRVSEVEYRRERGHRRAWRFDSRLPPPE
mgnify:FL=1